MHAKKYKTKLTKPYKRIVTWQLFQSLVRHVVVIDKNA